MDIEVFRNVSKCISMNSWSKSQKQMIHKRLFHQYQELLEYQESLEFQGLIEYQDLLDYYNCNAEI